MLRHGWEWVIKICESHRGKGGREDTRARPMRNLFLICRLFPGQDEELAARQEGVSRPTYA